MRQQILLEWNDTRVDEAPGGGIHRFFEAQASRIPEAVAVVSGDERATFGELNLRANRLAHHLGGLGVRPETRVAICMTRSLEMVAVILAVLKAGGAYVSLDPSHPKARLGFLLQDTGARDVLTERRLSKRLPAHGIRTVCLDASRDAIAREAGDDPASGVSPRHLAYLIYTSGSTGKPKGVALEHRGALALLNWARGVFTPEERGGVLFSTTTSFDVSVFELFLPLAWGGKMILAPNALAVADLAASAEVRMITTSPSAMAELSNLGAIPTTVGTVGLAGEALGTALTRQLYGRHRLDKVFDLYGPSEDTTYSTWALRSPLGPASIGRPIARTRAYVLDRSLRPVPVGVRGELHLAGAGLARCYLNRPARIAERFVPDPSSGAPGERLYRTGDVARHFSDGTLEFLGRLDFQVQLRGIRVELGEIEAALAGHPAVRETAVAVREGPAGTALVAYLVQKGQTPPTSEELRAFLGEKLPGSMVPAAYVRVAALPRTPSGKLDRAALLSLRGSLEIPVLELALAEIVRRHEALCTTFEAVDGTPTQRIAPPATQIVGLADLSALPETCREAETRRLTRREGQRLFDLTAGPLLRFRVLRLGPSEDVLIGAMHHIVSDGWSLGVLLLALVVWEWLVAGRRSSEETAAMKPTQEVETKVTGRGIGGLATDPHNAPGRSS